MKILKSMVAVIIILTAFASCKSDKKEQSNEEVVEIITDNFIDVIAKDFTFTVDSVIPSGWSTFRMKNTGMMEHFFLMTKLPDSFTIDDYTNEVGASFVKSWGAYKDGEVDKAGAYEILGANLPAWYANAQLMGGVGFISGGQLGITTMKLTPGNYVMECYVKAENGQFHIELGMINAITVSEEVTEMLPPKANAEITLTNESMAVEGEMISGNNIIAVHFNEHPVGLGNDIHLIRVDENTNMEAVTYWMDWLNIGGLTSPGSPAVFLGGAHEMPIGFTAYFNCRLEPGEYAFIAETPVGRFETFTVK